MKYMHFKALSIGHQNEQISRDFLHQISKEVYRSLSLHEKLWILRKLTNLNDLTEITDSNGFSKESLLPFAVSSQKIVHFHKMNRLQ